MKLRIEPLVENVVKAINTPDEDDPCVARLPDGLVRVFPAFTQSCPPLTATVHPGLVPKSRLRSGARRSQGYLDPRVAASSAAFRSAARAPRRVFTMP